MTAELLGTTRFDFIRRIGEGGFGIVYEAYDRARSMRVAVKVLRHAEGDSLYRFKREFRALASIAHRNIVSLYELLTDGTHWFFTMELVHGETIVSYVRNSSITVDDTHSTRRQRVNVDRLRLVLPQLVYALQTLHRAGIVHRDIKPGNVLVTPEGRVVVLDFGIVAEIDLANSTSPDTPSTEALHSSVLGTPAYMAPEQASTERVTSAADWYSVGVILYELLTGQLPFTGDPIDQLVRKQTGDAHFPADQASSVSPDWASACLNLLDPDPNTRGGPEVILDLVEHYQADEPAAVVRLTKERFVGRQNEIEAIHDAFEAAVAGRPSVVLLSGPSGIGKTELLDQCIRSFRQLDPALVVLSGSCNEHESTPYKSLDAIVDSLSRHLRQLRDIDVARMSPRDTAILARIFPVLRAVPEIDRRQQWPFLDIEPHDLRRRAAGALRELICNLAIRRRVILTLDDAQW